MGAINVNDHGELSFADLTFKFLKVVVLGTTDDLFFDLKMNPLSQTFQMNSST